MSEKRKPGRPPTGKPWQKWSERRKTCKECQQRKHPREFPYRSGGTYKTGDRCRECVGKQEAAGEIIGQAYIPRGKRLPSTHQIFKPTRIREHDLDPLAQHVLNAEGQIVDFEE